MTRQNDFDVIVVGGGHAGTEAALAAARTGARTLLLTQNIETLGQMSCNPAIGGIGKSHLVKEIDALGGAMAIAADRAGIHFRVLNGRKGPAVRATRAQADRQLYKTAIRAMLENQSGLSIFQQSVEDLHIEGTRVTGVVTNMGLSFYAPAVVLTVGTFLGGLIHIGMDKQAGGRAGDAPSNALARRLRELPFTVDRLKTGTPPRIDGRTVDYTDLVEQPGDIPRPVMSFSCTRADHPHQVSCFITHTSEKTHDIIRGGLDRSPLYAGEIEGVGPRYCPSIEDKVVRFADKNSHQIFIEPEGLGTHELYPNGISTSLPYDVQVNLVRSIKGFENAHITRPGYAIEYDFFEPRELDPSLQTRHIQGLYFAGQINGTTGYEEAAAQGLIAGLNAARQTQGKAPWCPKRSEAYIGVLIDDLITMGTREPYRMFTSRAEYRLILRQDNADRRLTEVGRELGLVDEARWRQYGEKRDAVERLVTHMKSTVVHPGNEPVEALLAQPLSREYSLFDLAKRPELTVEELLHASGRDGESLEVIEQVEIDTRYQGYIRRQQEEIERVQSQQDLLLPEGFDYSAIPGLSNEVVQKLNLVRPATLGQAARISGITAAAVSLLLVHLKKERQTPGQTDRLMDLSDRICSGLISLSIDPVPLLVSRLEQYLWLIAKWNKVTNLTSIDDPAEMVTVHLLDSLAVSPYLTGRRVLDVGSGAGLPGIPLALLRSDKDFILLDSNGKKTRFMTQATIELELANVTVIQSRIESFEGSFDHITCRAFRSTAEFAQQCGRLLVPGGSLLAMKGPAESQPSEVPGFRQSIHSLRVPGLSSQRYLVELQA